MLKLSGPLIAFALGAVALGGCSSPPASSAQTAATTWEARFTPPPGCAKVVVKVLGEARSSVLVQAYSFTSAPIAKALVDAHRRGVRVDVILDKSQRSERYSSADFLGRAGVPVKNDAVHAVAHNKIIVVDGTTVITGSFNFTRAADEKNAENLLVIRDRAVAERYAENWRAHAQHSEPARSRTAPHWPREIVTTVGRLAPTARQRAVGGMRRAKLGRSFIRSTRTPSSRDHVSVPDVRSS